MLQSFLPETAEKMFAYLNTKVTDLDSCESFGNLETDIHVVEKCEPLFARIDEKKFMEECNKEKEAAIGCELNLGFRDDSNLRPKVDI